MKCCFEHLENQNFLRRLITVSDIFETLNILAPSLKIARRSPCLEFRNTNCKIKLINTTKNSSKSFPLKESKLLFSTVHHYDNQDNWFSIINC